MSPIMIKTYHKCSLLVLLLNLRILEMEHKCALLLSTDLAWIFFYSCVRFFVLCSPIEKDSCFILGNFRMMYLLLVYAISIKFIITSWRECVQRYKKSWAAKLNCSMFQLFTTMGRRNHFHIFVSLSVNSENELAKMLLFP